MKKNFIILLLILISFSNAFSQDGAKNSTFNLNSGKTSQKQAVFIDLFPLMEGVWEGKAGAGLFYERQISNYFSVVGEVNLYSDFKDETAFSFLGHGRLYPFKTTIGNFLQMWDLVIGAVRWLKLLLKTLSALKSQVRQGGNSSSVKVLLLNRQLDTGKIYIPFQVGSPIREVLP